MSISWLQNLGSGFLVGGFEYFLCSPLPGERIQFDEHIFQRGWFNHQLGNICWSLKKSFENTLQKEDLIGLYRFYMFTTLGGIYMYMYII